MEIKNGQISILIGSESTTILIRDKDAATTFVKITLTPEQLSAALSKQFNVECEKMEVFGLTNVGKKHENAEHTFELPAECYDKRDLVKIHEEAIKTAPEGWKPDNQYGSKTSFLSGGNRKFARVTIRRWI